MGAMTKIRKHGDTSLSLHPLTFEEAIAALAPFKGLEEP